MYRMVRIAFSLYAVLIFGCGTGSGSSKLITLNGPWRGMIGIDELDLTLSQDANGVVTGDAIVLGANGQSIKTKILGSIQAGAFHLSADFGTTGYGVLDLSGIQKDRQLTSISFKRSRADGTVLEMGSDLTLNFYEPPSPPDNSGG